MVIDMKSDDSTMARNRPIYEAEIAALPCDGKRVRIVKRVKPASPLENVQYVETLDMEQARDLCERLEELINRA